jgi:hypothetical protein
MSLLLKNIPKFNASGIERVLANPVKQEVQTNNRRGEETQ